MENNVKMVFLTEAQCHELMELIERRFAEELACHDKPMKWACNMSDIYKKLQEEMTND